jgi:hypothetical protein
MQNCKKNCQKNKTITKRNVLFNILENKIIRDINTNNNINNSVVIGSLWGEVSSKSPYYKENQQSTYNTEITHIITTNYIKELDTKKWLQLDEKTFEIIEIINTGELNIELKLYCKIREQK